MLDRSNVPASSPRARNETEWKPDIPISNEIDASLDVRSGRPYRLVSSHVAPLDARLATGVRGYHPLFVLRFLSPLFKSFFEPL